MDKLNLNRLERANALDRVNFYGRLGRRVPPLDGWAALYVLRGHHRLSAQGQYQTAQQKWSTRTEAARALRAVTRFKRVVLVRAPSPFAR